MTVKHGSFQDAFLEREKGVGERRRGKRSHLWSGPSLGRSGARASLNPASKAGRDEKIERHRLPPEELSTEL